MKILQIPETTLSVSEIALGCMRLRELPQPKVDTLIETAIDEGINFFDHADIYGQGLCEELFGRAIKNVARDKLIIQTKCGIRTGFYDFSKQHILSSVESSLKRLNTDYLDTLLLHRPDTLMEPEEVAEAFDTLEKGGKVRYFGVSNHNPGQIRLLSKYISQKLVFNQLQISVMASGMIDSGLNVNTATDLSINRDGGVLEFCRLNDITIQPWSPFFSFEREIITDNAKYPELYKKLSESAETYGVGVNAIAIAWLLRHPAKMQPIVGTTNPDRLKDICTASKITLTREEWYGIYRASGKKIP